MAARWERAARSELGDDSTIGDERPARRPRRAAAAPRPQQRPASRRRSGATPTSRHTTVRTATSDGRHTPPAPALPLGSHSAPLPPPEPPPVQHPAPLPPPQPPPELGAGGADDENWTPYHLSTPTATALAPAATAQAASPKQPPPNPPDDTAARRRSLPAPQHPFPNQTYTDGCPMREPGPMALPRAAGEHTDQEPSGVLDHYFRHLGAGGQPQPAGDWAHFANVGALARTKRLFCCCTVAGPPPPFAIRKEYHTHPGPVASYDATPRAVFPRVFPPGLSRTARDLRRWLY